MTMRFHASINEQASSGDAVKALADDATAALGGKIDLAFLFFSGHHAPEMPDLVEQLWLELDAHCIVGCSAEGVLGVDREIEGKPGMALLVGHTPQVRVHPFHIGRSEWRTMISDSEGLTQRLGLTKQTVALIGFGDPFTTPLPQWLTALDDLCPQAPLWGGMASSARSPGENLLLRNDQVFDEGFVGISLSGGMAVRSIVSQGCRPVGRPMVVTKANQNVIQQLGGKPALRALHEIIEGLSAADQELLGQGVLIGRAIDEYREQFGRGDFLVRNVVGVDDQSGAIAMADYVRVGQTVQFHVRDAASADEDLHQMLASAGGDAAGGLLFTCNGRGTRLFDQPSHDITAARQHLPRTPLAGFFAAGELGPVGGRNFIHGHTASFALFEPQPS